MKKPEWVAHIPTQNADRVKDWYMVDVLHRFNGNKTHAAKAMGITVRGFRNMLIRLENEGYPVSNTPKNCSASDMEGS
jgi:transcriptional regulator with AAA-type ATPase domain